MAKFSLYVFSVLFLLVAACESEEVPYNDQPVEPFQEEEFVSSVWMIEDSFPDFPTPEIAVILEEMGFCVSKDSLDVSDKSLCSPNLFRIFPLDTVFDLGTGFLVDARRGVLSNTTSKALIVIANINGGYEMRNFYKGKLLEMRTTREGRFDLVMSYRDPNVGTITVRHAWESEKQAYLPIEVLELNNRFVKEAYKDSLNQVYLTDFAWGY